MKSKKTLIITSLICLLPMLVGALVYSRLPEQVATHFDLQGNPDGWSSRAFAVFGLPGILLAVNLLIPFALQADPKHKNMSGALVNIVIWTVPVISLLCSGLTLGRALGYDLRIEMVLPVFHHGHQAPVDAGKRGKLEPHPPPCGLSLGTRRRILHRHELYRLEPHRLPDSACVDGACPDGVFVPAVQKRNLIKPSPPDADASGGFSRFR